VDEDITQEEADYLRVRGAIDEALSGDAGEIDAGIILGALVDVSLELIMAGDNLSEREAIESLVATLQELAADSTDA